MSLTESVYKKDPFGVLQREPAAAQVLDARELVQLGVKFDPATGSTTPDESNIIDLVELTQTYKDQCGMELANRLLKNGLATAADFKDDGKHGFDATLPGLESAQAAANAAIQAEKNVSAMLGQLGLDKNALTLSEEQLSAIISKTISEKFPQLIAQSQETKPDAE